MSKKLIIVVFLAILLLSGFDCKADNLKSGLKYYYSGDYKKAETVFRQLLLKQPYNYSAQYMLAVSLVNRKKYAEAKELYKNIILNSQNSQLTSLSKTGLKNLGEHKQSPYQNGIDKAVISINTSGTVMIVNNVRLNDSLNAKFVLDTGATYTTISKTAARQLKISTHKARTLKIMTGSGYINAPLVKIPKIEIKGLIVRNVDAVVTDLPIHKSGTNQEIVGLLGLSFLENFKFTVDRNRGQIFLEKN